MAGGIRRNSAEGDMGAVRSALLSTRNEDLRVRAELVASGAISDPYRRSKDSDYQIWLRRAGWR